MVQSPPSVRYCGHCGAPLAPNATFCERCGTPVAQTQAAYPYPQAPYAPYRRSRGPRLSQWMIAGGLIAVLLVIAIVVSAIAVAQFSGGTHAACKTDCAPKFITPYPEEASYRSSAYQFQVNYNTGWTVRNQSPSAITLGTKIGSVTITGSKGGSPDQAVQSTVNALPSTQYQDVTLVANLKGAHLADQNGLGAVYSANFVGSSQTAAKIRFAVIAATHGGVTVVVFVVDPADPKNFPNGMEDGQAVDYLCTEFAWGSG